MASYSHGFSLRKLGFLRRFLGPCQPVRSLARIVALRPGDQLYLWGSTSVPDGLAEGVAICRVEDGFLRSVGLGAALAAPLSWVFDWSGIYYDASRPSDIELMLAGREFTEPELARAAALRARIVESGLSKYNVDIRHGWRRTSSRRTILVPGQVEADASIRLGAARVHTNLGLLRAVRLANPGAHVIYKPHPDVVQGLRQADDGLASSLADEVVVAANISDLLGQVDEVHVMTSLTGFEALLRQKKVVCYGQPFYSGWGLTQDVYPVPRRTWQRSLDELVAAALIAYPAYLHPDTGVRAEVEDVVAGLQKLAGKAPSLASKVKARLARWAA